MAKVIKTVSVEITDGAALQKLVDKARNSKGREPYTNVETAKPMLWFVKDQGAYVMESLWDANESPVVIYFDDYGPECDWSSQQSAFGGDDFAAPLELPSLNPGEQILKLVMKLDHTAEGVSYTSRWFCTNQPVS